MEDVKVIFIAYNRPQYFKQELESIKDQVMGMDVHLILDGPKEKQLKGESTEWMRDKFKAYQFGYEEDERRINECEQLFKEAFKSYPDIDRRVHREKENIGGDRNVGKAYYVAFEELGAKYAFFIEDDFVFAPVYVEQLKILFDFCKDDKDIVIMTCFGYLSREWPPGILDKQYCKLIEQSWLCGSLWKRDAWEILKPHFDIYLDLIKNNPWDVFVEKLKAYTKSIGIHYLDSAGGEDSFLANVLSIYQKLRVSTAGEYLYNIGKTGAHCYEEMIGNHPMFIKNIYPKVARELYIDKQHRGFQLQLTGSLSEDWEEKRKKIIENTLPY